MEIYVIFIANFADKMQKLEFKTFQKVSKHKRNKKFLNYQRVARNFFIQTTLLMLPRGTKKLVCKSYLPRTH